MADHILTLVAQAEQERLMAKMRTEEPIKLVAQIVFYVHGREAAYAVKYVKMKEAKKQFEQLLNARQNGAPIILTGSASTMSIACANTIDICYLVDTEADNVLAADQQRRFQALMMAP